MCSDRMETPLPESGESRPLSAPRRMKALTLAGRIILENGGETYRAEDTVLRMAQAMGLREPEAFCVPSGIFISFVDENGDPRTAVCRVRSRGIHLARVDAVNQISRRLVSGQLGEGDLPDALADAAGLGGGDSFWHTSLASLMAAAAFSVMFGGGPWDALASGLCAGLTPLLPRLLLKGKDSSMAYLLLGSFASTFLPLWFHRLTGLGLPEAMIAGALMPLVPGLSMTNAVQDVLRGDMISGVAHGARAALSAALIAGGALLGTYVTGLLGGVL